MSECSKDVKMSEDKEEKYDGAPGGGKGYPKKDEEGYWDFIAGLDLR